jgi:predicted phosphodiesterase
VKVGVFSDVHGNLPALEAVLAQLHGEVDAYICLGDAVNYGPWSEECVQLICSLSSRHFLEGNHERLYLGLDPLNHETPLVQAFTRQTRPWFRSLALITDLPLSVELGDYLAVHTIDGQRVYVNTEIEVTRNYLIGHTHHQFRTTRNNFEIINCGSVGQNRRSLRCATYAVYDRASRALELRSTEYDAELLVQEMLVRGYPSECIAYYKSKL